MEPRLDLKPAHAPVKAYYSALHQLGQLSISHEMAVRSAFQGLLHHCARKFDWTLVPEYRIAVNRHQIQVDGAVLDRFRLTRGLWEAKDSRDDLEKEAKKKFSIGYPRQNIIFQSPERALLYQKGIRWGGNEDITDANNLVALLKEFFELAGHQDAPQQG
jgi:hypothetical protein